MDRSPSADHMRQNMNIINEVASINQKARDQYTYKKSTNWHQLPADTQILNQANQLEQIIQKLDSIEEKLDSLGKMLNP